VVKEFKPEVGDFIIPAGGELEVFDHKAMIKVDRDRELEYIRHTALELANSVINDIPTESTRLNLSIEVRE
jgi:predicted component of type VI protein secretion system